MSDLLINEIKKKKNYMEIKNQKEEEKNEELNDNIINSINQSNKEENKEFNTIEKNLKNNLFEQKKLNNIIEEKLNEINENNNEIKQENNDNNSDKEKDKCAKDETNEEEKNELEKQNKKEEENEEDEKSDDNSKEEENEEKSKEKSEEDNSLKDLNKKKLCIPKKNSFELAEKEIEESFDRISRLKEKLIESRKGEFCTNVKLSEREIFTVIDKVYPILESEESMLELEPPIYICGDIHGQFYDLLRVFDILKYPPESKFLFLGDYVDRGKKSLECILLLLCLKIKYPSKIFLLRGNHESEDINRTYGFLMNVKGKYLLKYIKNFALYSIFYQ